MKSLVLVMIAAAALALPAAGAERTAIFAGGCFWCIEADYEKLPGVIEARSGYTGGSKADATYDAVTRGDTGHFEAVAITYDDTRISYRELVSRFFRSVDPTDAGGQFCDRGSSYRTAIFPATPAEKAVAEQEKTRAAAELGRGIVTPILPAGPFYLAEAYHQDYYKSAKRTLTRFGYITRKEAYKRYRRACGRDARVRELWGESWSLPGR